MSPRPQIPSDVEEHRDARWRREGTLQTETAFEAERFIAAMIVVPSEVYYQPKFT